MSPTSGKGGTPGKKVFGVLVTLDETDPARLRPGMTVDLEMVLGTVNHAVMVPIRVVFKEKGRSLVYLAQGDTFERVPVTTGMRNDLRIEVRGRLHPGDRVALDICRRSGARSLPPVRSKGTIGGLWTCGFGMIFP